MGRKSKEEQAGFTPVDKIIRSVVKSLENPQKLQEAHLVELWQEHVEEELKNKARPSRLVGKKLYIEVFDSIWIHELTINYRQKILKLLQEKVGTENLKEIQFTGTRSGTY